MVKDTPKPTTITNSSLLNRIPAARGTPVNEGDTESYDYGFSDVSFWIPSLQRWIPSDQSFIVTSTDYDSAKQIFWDKWRSYCKRRFRTNYIQIERQ